MKVKDLIAQLKVFNPEAEVYQMYDGMAQDIRMGPASPEDLDVINERREECNAPDDDEPLDHAIAFRAGC